MQSGISVSKELRDAFNELVSSPAQRGLIATIESEAIKPLHTLPASTTDFFADLSKLAPLLSDNQAAYIILRRYQNAPDGFVAVTFVPNTAPIRQKTLFASTRLTLTRELGIERFRESLFATELKELTKQGWEAHELSSASQAPLTTEEETLKGVKEAEAEERGGTQGRRLETGGKLSMVISEAARNAVEALKISNEPTLVQFCVDTKNESIELIDTALVPAQRICTTISESEPRYSLYKHTQSSTDSSDQTTAPILFIYTCPAGQKVRDRMLYASSKQGFLAALSTDLDIEVAYKFEVTNPSEITVEAIDDEIRPKQEQKQSFARPKRPGKR